MKWILFLSFALVGCSPLVKAQNDCTCDLDYVINYYEANLPGFKDNVGPDNQKEYEAFKKKLQQEAQKAQQKVACFKVLTYFVEFFKDNHSGIYMSIPSINEDDPQALKAFLEGEIFQSRERYDLKVKDKKQYPIEDIRGIYQTKDAAYTIAVIPNEGPFRKYIGVIIDSKTKLWEKGQVKMEINEKKEGGYEAFVYMRNHSLRYQPNFSFNAGVLGSSWFKTNKSEKVNYATNPDRELAFEMMDNQLAYLRIPSFSGGYSAQIDSFYKAIKPQMKQAKRLIIDVRDNGGGSDDNVSPLLDYIYTNPIQSDKVDVYATTDNAKVWEGWYNEIKEDKVNYSKGDVKWFKKELDAMKKATPGSFIPRSDGSLFKRKVNPNKPQAVAVLYNKGCASSCETLLFWAQQSTNTVLVGENSGGYVGYGEVGSVETPCYEYTLSCTMTRYTAQRAYEVVGVPPDHPLSYEKDWIDQTKAILEKNN